MGNSLSGASASTATVLDQAPKSRVPTATEIERAKLSSEWWNLQKVKSVAPPVALESYGASYGRQHEKSCGQYKAQLKKCIDTGKFDYLNMSQWYATCGNFHELESMCTTSFLQEVDRKCQKQLDQAAAFVKDEDNDRLIAAVAEKRLAPQLTNVGFCVGKQSVPGLTPAQETQATDAWKAKKVAFAR